MSELRAVMRKKSLTGKEKIARTHCLNPVLDLWSKKHKLAAIMISNKSEKGPKCQA